MDTTPPTVIDMVDVTPDPRDRWITDIDLEFSEQIDPSTFTREDLTLLRDGAIVPWDASVTVSRLAASTYRVAGLKNFTSAPGDYQLIVDAAGITDPAGNAGVGTVSDTWNVVRADRRNPRNGMGGYEHQRRARPRRAGHGRRHGYLDYNNNGKLDDEEPSTVTSADDPATPEIDEAGTYHFTNVVSGEQTVRQVVPSDFGQTFPADRVRTVSSWRSARSVGRSISATSTPSRRSPAVRSSGDVVCPRDH